MRNDRAKIDDCTLSSDLRRIGEVLFHPASNKLTGQQAAEQILVELQVFRAEDFDPVSLGDGRDREARQTNGSAVSS